MKEKLDKIEDAIEDIKNVKFLIVVDDEDRENEGDFICAAEKITPQMVNFMLTNILENSGNLISANIFSGIFTN